MSKEKTVKEGLIVGGTWETKGRWMGSACARWTVDSEKKQKKRKKKKKEAARAARPG